MKSIKILLFFAFIGISFAVKVNIIEDYLQPDGRYIPMQTKQEMGQSSGSNDQYVTSFPEPDSDQIYELNHKEDCNCRLRATGKIVNGMIAQPHSIPWMVSLANQKNEHFCGGVIINRLYILTSARCVHEISFLDIKVRIGLHRLDDPDIDKKTYNVLEIFRFRDLTGGDIAILKLSQPIDKFEVGKVEPACLDTYSLLKKFPLGFMASGWGLTSTFEKHGTTGELKNLGKMSPVLKMGFFKEDKDKRSNFIHIYSDKGDSVCLGDMGGPLHYIENGLTSVVATGAYFEGIGKANDYIKMCTEKSSAAFGRLANLNNKYFLERVVGANYCKFNMLKDHERRLLEIDERLAQMLEQQKKGQK